MLAHRAIGSVYIARIAAGQASGKMQMRRRSLHQIMRMLTRSNCAHQFKNSGAALIIPTYWPRGAAPELPAQTASA